MELGNTGQDETLVADETIAADAQKQLTCSSPKDEESNQFGNKDELFYDQIPCTLVSAFSEFLKVA